MSHKRPIVYSFRRCPYAMRARLAIASSRVQVELREVVLKQKPDNMLEASPKGTVPVLITIDGEVIDESLDIMHWALNQSDPEELLCCDNELTVSDIASLIDHNDFVFKAHLDRYKYFDRHPEQPQAYYRQQGELTLAELESRLSSQQFLCGDTPSLADLAIFPFIRQFAFVDKVWFDQSPYPALIKWLNGWLESELFISVMNKYPQWQADETGISFPE